MCTSHQPRTTQTHWSFMNVSVQLKLLIYNQDNNYQPKNNNEVRKKPTHTHAVTFYMHILTIHPTLYNNYERPLNLLCLFFRFTATDPKSKDIYYFSPCVLLTQKGCNQKILSSTLAVSCE